MIRQGIYRRTVRGMSSLCLASTVAMASAACAGADKSILALAQFDFRDTSGEPQDQSSAHEARLKSFNDTLRDGLAGNQEIEIVGLSCATERCTHRAPGLAALARQAKTAGARYLLVGEIRKVSTLIGRVRLAVLDLNDNRPACEQLLTYRGDTDEAWQRTARYTLRHIEENCLPPR